MRLIAIKGSHYVERARWALDIAGIEYTEDCYPPGLHLNATLAATNSKAHSVPMLLTPDAGILCDSKDIVKYAWATACARPMQQQPPSAAGSSGTDSHALARGLYPQGDPAKLAEVERIEALCADKLGVWTRLYMYQQLLQDKGLATHALCQGVSTWNRWVFWLVFPTIRARMVKFMDISQEHAEEALKNVRSLFQELGQILEAGDNREGSSCSADTVVLSHPLVGVASTMSLAESCASLDCLTTAAEAGSTQNGSTGSTTRGSGGGGSYLVGDSFTAADLTFACMASLLLCPPGYGADISALEKVLLPVLWELRGTRAGKHALAMFQKHRHLLPVTSKI